jgi:hypothetical protein
MVGSHQNLSTKQKEDRAFLGNETDENMSEVFLSYSHQVKNKSPTAYNVRAAKYPPWIDYKGVTIPEYEEVKGVMEGQSGVMFHENRYKLETPQHHGFKQPLDLYFHRFKLANVFRYLRTVSKASCHSEAVFNLLGGGLGLLFGTTHPLICETPIEPLAQRESNQPNTRSDAVKYYVPKKDHDGVMEPSYQHRMLEIQRG